MQAFSQRENDDDIYIVDIIIVRFYNDKQDNKQDHYYDFYNYLTILY